MSSLQIGSRSIKKKWGDEKHHGGYMGLFKFFKKKDTIPEEVPEFSFAEELNRIQPEKESKKTTSAVTEDQITVLKENCNQIMEASKQIEDAKVEYQLVTSYLTDIQKIDFIPPEEREVMEDAARKIITFTRERAKLQNNEIKITDIQLKNMERYETIIPNEIVRMKEEETYNSLVKNDMKHLEGEKGALLYQKKETIAKQKYLKNLAVITSVLVFILFILLMAVAVVFETSMSMPFIMTIVMAAASVFYIFLESRKNTYNIQLVERKLNRAISLLNRVKIKYVNNTNSLDYSYNKYVINSAMELEYLWGQYIKAKEEQKRYKKNTELLNYYNEVLIDELKKFKIGDPDIWIYQSSAIIDNTDMYEVRHRLNVRRKKLRERMEYNTKLKEGSLKEIQDMVIQKPDLKIKVKELLKTYHIEI
jgi:hypothetical protein